MSMEFGRVKAVIMAKIGIDAVCAFALRGAPIDAAFVILVTIPALCLVGFLHAWRRRGRGEAVGAQMKPWRTILFKQFAPIGMGAALLCFGFSFSQTGFQDTFSGIDNSYTLGIQVSVLGRFVTFAVMGAALRFMRDCHFEVLFRVSILVAAIGFLSLILPFEGRFTCFSVAVIVASFVAENAMTLLTVYASKHATNSPVRILAFGQLALRVGGLCGVVAGNAIASAVAAGTHMDVLPYLVSLEVLLLTLSGMYFIREQSVNRLLWEVVPVEGDQAAPDAVTCKAALLADAFGLTQREQEVLALLLKGRSIPYIKETLYISANTAKTSIRKRASTSAKSSSRWRTSFAAHELSGVSACVRAVLRRYGCVRTVGVLASASLFAVASNSRPVPARGRVSVRFSRLSSLLHLRVSWPRSASTPPSPPSPTASGAPMRFRCNDGNRFENYSAYFTELKLRHRKTSLIGNIYMISI